MASDIGTVCLILAIFIGIVPPILMQDKINQAILDKGATAVEEKTNSAIADAEALEKYSELLSKGIITEEEFNQKKADLLAKL